MHRKKNISLIYAQERKKKSLIYAQKDNEFH